LSTTPPVCRACGAPLVRTFVDLGNTPLANSYLTAEALDAPEPRYPLHARVCDHCLLVQLEAVTDARQIFDDYAYFSSYSDSWVEHAARFAKMAEDRWDLHPKSQVVEVASNDGYLLRHFIDAGIPALGIEPARNVAQVAIEAGVPTEVSYFGTDVARALVARGVRADLLVGNNVLAHVPDLNDFVAGLAALLAPDGVLSLEFPHLLRLIEGCQFDTIYHEHFSYFSLLSAQAVLAAHGLRIFDVETLPTHGGSLRLLACHEVARHPTEPSVDSVRAEERAAGLDDPETYAGFNVRADACRTALRQFLDAAAADGRQVVGYGAAAKGNTLLNFAGIGRGRVPYVADRNPHKQGRFLPGSRIPVVAPDEIRRTRPDIVLVLAWNLLDEVRDQLAYVSEWGGRFAVPLPTVRIIE
jgi:SAM-dependent methyltransferase